MTNPIQQSKGVPPSEYTPHLDRIFASQVAFIAKRRRERLLRRVMWASVMGLVCVVVWRVCR